MVPKYIIALTFFQFIVSGEQYQQQNDQGAQQGQQAPQQPHENTHHNDHKQPVTGCTIENYDFCLNGGKCASGGICTCARGYIGLRCENSICPNSKALSTKTGKCLDVDQYILEGETTSIPWHNGMKKISHDYFINAADLLEKFITDMMKQTLSYFVEAKVVEFTPRQRGVHFKIRIRIKLGESTTDPVLWYRWSKRAIKISSTSPHQVYIVPESLKVEDEDECRAGNHRCTETQGSTCHNELGSYTCRCDVGLVDMMSRNTDRAGVDCRDPCSQGGNGTTIHCMHGAKCVPKLEDPFKPLCICPMGFTGDYCQHAAESMVILLSLWGVVLLALLAFVGVVIYKCVKRKQRRDELNADDFKPTKSETMRTTADKFQIKH